MSNVPYLGDSSNGRTSDSGSGSAGSTPASGTIPPYLPVTKEVAGTASPYFTSLLKNTTC